MKKVIVVFLLSLCSVLFATEQENSKFMISVSTPLFTQSTMTMDLDGLGDFDVDGTTFGLEMNDLSGTFGYNVSGNIYLAASLSYKNETSDPEMGEESTETGMVATLGAGYLHKLSADQQITVFAGFMFGQNVEDEGSDEEDDTEKTTTLYGGVISIGFEQAIGYGVYIGPTAQFSYLVGNLEQGTMDVDVTSINYGLGLSLSFYF